MRIISCLCNVVNKFPNQSQKARKNKHQRRDVYGAQQERRGSMKELYNLVVETAKERLKKEKETNLTDETLRLIYLAKEMHPWVTSQEN